VTLSCQRHCRGTAQSLYSKKEQALIVGGRRQTIFAVYSVYNRPLRSPNEDRKTADAQFALIRQECAVADDVPSWPEDCTFSVVFWSSLGDRNCTQLFWSTLEVKVRTLDIATLRATPPQKRTGMARVLKGSQFTCTPTRSSAIGMYHTCLCLPSYSWYSFTAPRGMEGWVGLGGALRSETVYLPEGSHPSHY